ncbi:(R)-benzylsuccinyl-CoA dehydrogenase [Symmachiella macrocystis]|uniref:(R)-benzylsuccinyl-CoA dehydrogenase n=1 Tax=Symmachiella macrocystis TaxID=2527985 RepID=A0A5C6BPJ3_9PLAN|nr:acyl-CoA dehydrogenase family protein [Symmachiella macrocystis]TWU12929.1 (R)-benzylsuccinyl-CoA dehydrogenase [Symmachiella macrocystis]
MDFSIPTDIQDMLANVGQFLREEVYPLEERFVSGTFADLVPTLEEKRTRVKEMKLWAPQVPAEYGGVGLGFMQHAMLSEELGRTPMGHYVFNCQAPDAGNMEILAEFGTAAQKEQFLLPLAAGKSRSCFAMTEPECAGSNPVWMKTTAVRDGDEYVINGHKWFSSAADGAAFAVAMVVTNPDAEPHQRASQIIVPTDVPGYRWIRNIPVMGHAGDGWPSHSELRFDNVRVPVSNLLGEEGAGFSIAQARLGPGRIHHCMRWIGICERSFDLMCQRAATRELAPGDPLGNRQTVQNWIAESRAEINAARLMVLHAAWKIDNEGTKAAREEISAIKFYVAGVLMAVVDRAIQVHGALGVSDDTILQYFYRQERGARIYDGPDEVHKTVLAKRALRSFGMKK